MNFKKINEILVDEKPSTFLTTVLAQESDSDPFFVFSLTIENQFEKNIEYLASEETISSKEVDEWKRYDFLVVAQTIDGDYIAGEMDKTLIIPTSLYKTDIEIFSMPLGEFFMAYENGSILSTILPKM